MIIIDFRKYALPGQIKLRSGLGKDKKIIVGFIPSWNSPGNNKF